MARNPGLPLVGGRSDHLGFTIFGNVPTPALESATAEALRRLQAGEARLAVHPNCGTNLVTSGALTGMAVITATTIGRFKRVKAVEQIPLAILAATGALVASRPLGMRLQRDVTTLADVDDLRLTGITRRQIGRLVLHAVRLEEITGV